MNQNPNSDQNLMFSFKNIIVLSLVFLFLVSPRTSSSSLSVQEQARAITTVHRQLTSSEDDDDHGVQILYRLFYIKNTKPFASSRDSTMRVSNRMIKKSSSSRPILKRRDYKINSKKIKIKNSILRPNFSVMLPKGFVPPSGSSPCHNQNPNSVVFFCGAMKP